jgi:purine-binding chemotaxis protein CheW
LKYLSFMLADQFCAIELSAVRELLGYMPFSPLTAEHPSIVGWFDLRGEPVRVMDLRVRFGLPVTRTDDTVMIVVESLGERFAVIVDSVIGLEKIAAISSIALPPRVRLDPRCVIGSATIQDRAMLLLDLAQTTFIQPPLPRAA